MIDALKSKTDPYKYKYAPTVEDFLALGLSNIEMAIVDRDTSKQFRFVMSDGLTYDFPEQWCKMHYATFMVFCTMYCTYVHISGNTIEYSFV